MAWGAPEDETKWRAELERLGVDVVRMKAAASDTAPAALFMIGPYFAARGFVDDWLAEKLKAAQREEQALRSATLDTARSSVSAASAARWAAIAAVASAIASAIQAYAALKGVK